MRTLVIALIASAPLFASTPPPLICTSGAAVGTIDLRVVSPSPRNEKHPLPLRTITRLEEGDVVTYRPILRPHEERKGEVTLVLAPADKKAGGGHSILIFDARPAAKPQQWIIPWRTSLAAFVYGPGGLNVKKVESFLDKDDELIGQLADYADKTAKAEALIAALSSPDSSKETVNAAMQGFSAQYGGTLAKGAPLDQQSLVTLQTVNPSVAAYDPLAPSSAEPIGAAARLAASVGQLFLGNPAGLAVGGTAMLMNLSAIAFPKSEFRSMFSQPMPDDDLGLCAAKGSSSQAHTRVDYLWAVRIPNAAAPRLAVGKANSLPADVKSPLPLTGSDWKYLDHARDWMLTPDRGKPVAVKVQVLEQDKNIEVALDKNMKPGRYSISASWDWDQFEVGGFFEVRPLDAFLAAKLTPAAQDSLVADTGKVPLTLENADFEFVTKVEIKKINDEFATASAVPFILPKGLREGPQNHMDIQADTGALLPGPYNLMVSQVDGKAHDIRLTVLPPAPVFENLPVAINENTTGINVDLKGRRLNLIDHIQLSKGTAILGAASPDGTSRRVGLKLPAGLPAGTTISFQARVVNRTEPLSASDGFEIVSPRPLISGINISQAPDQQVRLDPGELPGNVVFTAMLNVANLPCSPSVKLECEQTSTGATTLQPGQSDHGARLEQLTADQLFLTLDAASWINRCNLQASILGAAGDSTPHPIARIVDVPAIEQFTLDPSPAANVGATLIGKNLETIEKAGWTAQQAVSVSNLPQPLPGDELKQKLDFRLPPPPSPDAVLYLWLRGDSKPRVTTIRAK